MKIFKRNNIYVYKLFSTVKLVINSTTKTEIAYPNLNIFVLISRKI